MKSKVLLALVVFSFVLIGSCRRPLVSKALLTGVSAAREDRWDEAVLHWEKTLEQDPGSAAARNNLAIAYEKQGAWEEARKEYEAALRLDPDNPTIKDNFQRFKARLAAARGRNP